jgi:tRNA pseudouridine38-40 synthase
VPRVAVRIAYDGTRFSGSQRQPDVRTVDGELLFALRKVGAAESAEQCRFQSASRTDKGVSAAGNVVAFDTQFRLDALLPALGAAAQDVWPHALAVVPDGFEARRARTRTYVYFLHDPGVDPAALAAALRGFEGTHDFRAFARLEPGVDPVRTVLRTDARSEGAWHTLTVHGESFLWNQVRRMVSAAQRVGRGEASPEDIARGLAGAPVDLGVAPAEGLVLQDVDHGLAWTVSAAARDAARRELEARLLGWERSARVMRTLRDALG